VGGFLAILIYSYISPTATYGQYCSEIAPTGGYFGNEKYNKYTNITPDTGDKIDIKQTLRAPEGDDKRTVGMNFDPRTYHFSQIFFSMYNIVNAYVTSDQPEEEALREPWSKSFCIDVDNTDKTSSFNFTGDATLRYGYEVDVPCDPPTNPDGSPNIGCTEDKTASKNFDLAGGGSFTVPYPYSFRKMAEVVPAIIDKGFNFCTTQGIQTGCNRGFECKEISPDLVAKYPALRDPPTDKNGVCFPDEQLAQAHQKDVNLLCRDIKSTPIKLQPLKSNVCFEQSWGEGLKESWRITDEKTKRTTPYISGGSIGGTNQINYDLQALNWYEAAFVDKLSIYSKDEANWIKKLPARFSRLSVGEDAKFKTDPSQGSDDFVEKLGGAAMMAEDARFMNTSLIPAGLSTMMDGGHEAYLRGGDNRDNYGVLFVDGKPVGRLQDVKQVSPYIHTNKNTGAFVALVIDYQGNLYISKSTPLNPTPSELTKVGSGDSRGQDYRPAAFINSYGDIIIFAKVGGIYKYGVIKNGDTQLGSWNNIGGRTAPEYKARFAMGNDDKVNIAWYDRNNGRLYYSKLDVFDHTKIHLVAEAEDIGQKSQIINGGREISDLGVPFTLQLTLPDNNVLFAATTKPNGGDKDQNQIWFTYRDNNGSAWTPAQLVTDQSVTSDTSELYSFSALGGNKIALLNVYNPASKQNERHLYLVYKDILRKYTDPSNRAEHQENSQIRFAHGVLNGNNASWDGKYYPVTDIAIGELQNYVDGEGITQTGQPFATVVENVSKYDPHTRLVDFAGAKRCVLLEPLPSTSCARTGGLGIIYPPRENAPLEAVDYFTGIDYLTGQPATRKP
jgi:hypothetical protein